MYFSMRRTSKGELKSFIYKYHQNELGNPDETFRYHITYEMVPTVTMLDKIRGLVQTTVKHLHDSKEVEQIDVFTNQDYVEWQTKVLRESETP